MIIILFQRHLLLVQSLKFYSTIRRKGTPNIMSDTPKMRMETQDMSLNNIEKLAALFPSVMTESRNEQGELVRAIDFEKLRMLLGDAIVAGDERYDFTWVGKNAAIQEYRKPIRKTLRPYKDESKNWDSTENLYIEGDNLDVLKLLQESYLGKVKMIYIDPPYNTGNDSFVYPDKYTMDKDEYEEGIGLHNDEGEINFKQNNDGNPRFHSDWCSMMYSRLTAAYNLLRDDGVIFISIDDNEVCNLRKICDDVFGEHNFIASLMWNKQHSQQQGLFKKYHEYILVIAKNVFTQSNISGGDGIIEAGALKKISKANPESEFIFPAGVRIDAADGTTFLGTFGGSEKVTVVSGTFSVKSGKTEHKMTLSAGWTQKNQMEKYFRGENVIDTKGQKVLEFYFSSTGKLKCRKARSKITPSTILPLYGMVSEQTEYLAKLLNANVFDNPKPLLMIRDFLNWFTSSNDIILDFFSGSATTAHAVMQLNAEDGGKRKFIMVQLPEKCGEQTEAFKEGYKNICEIGKERIRRAGDKIVAENPLLTGDLDTGFRVFKLDDSNMKDVYFGAEELSQTSLQDYTDNIKPDRTDLDLFFSCLLEWGIPLSCPQQSEQIENVTVHSYTINTEDNDILYMGCFATKISENVVREIAKRKPLRVVFRDSSFESSAARINVEEFFKLLSPNTTVQVL